MYNPNGASGSGGGDGMTMSLEARILSPSGLEGKLMAAVHLEEQL